MIRPHALALLAPLLLFGCDRPSDPIEPTAGSSAVAGGASSSPSTEPVPDPPTPTNPTPGDIPPMTDPAGADTASGANAPVSTAPADVPPVTDPATSPAPVGTLPTAPTPAGTVATDPPAATTAAPAPPAASSAVVTLQPTAGHKGTGLLDLMPHPDGVHFGGRLAGLSPNAEHGFHVHETGDCSAPDASSAGGHFNPGGDMHGAPDAASHHAGDMSNAQADAQGEADIDLIVSGLEIGTAGPRDVLGRALVVHQKADDFRTQPDGGAGPRIACGVIVRR